MKKLLAILGLSSVTLFAQIPSQSVYVTNNMAASATTIISKSIDVGQLTFWTTNTSTTLVYLYDGAITNVTAAYTNYTTYSTNIVSNYVTTTGTTNSLTNHVIYNAAVAVAAATNNSSPYVTIVVPGSLIANAAGQFVTYTPPTELVFRNKLTLSNSAAGLNGVISYRNP